MKLQRVLRSSSDASLSEPTSQKESITPTVEAFRSSITTAGKRIGQCRHSALLDTGRLSDTAE